MLSVINKMVSTASKNLSSPIWHYLTFAEVERFAVFTNCKLKIVVVVKLRKCMEQPI